MRPMTEDEYQAEADMHLMKAAEELEKNPRRMAQARKVARKKAQELLAFANEEMDEEAEVLGKGYRKL